MEYFLLFGGALYLLGFILMGVLIIQTAIGYNKREKEREAKRNKQFKKR